MQKIQDLTLKQVLIFVWQWRNLVPGVSCNIDSLLKDAETAEKQIKETEQEAKHLKDSMYK